MMQDVLELMDQSEFHRQYSVDDIERLIVPAIENNRCVVYYHKDMIKPVGMFTYMWLNQEAERGYLEGTRKLQAEDWATDHLNGTLYVIDFIAPYNNGVTIARKCRRYLSAHTYKDKEGRFVRMTKGGRIGRVGRVHAKPTYN